MCAQAVFAYSHHHYNHYPSHYHWWCITIITIITIIVIGRAARVVCVYLHPNWMVLARGGPFHHQPSRALFITKSSSLITIKRHHHNQSLILSTYSSSPVIIIVIHEKLFAILSKFWNIWFHKIIICMVARLLLENFLQLQRTLHHLVFSPIYVTFGYSTIAMRYD